jgi:hypothetical protein
MNKENTYLKKWKLQDALKEISANDDCQIKYTGELKYILGENRESTKVIGHNSSQ